MRHVQFVQRPMGMYECLTDSIGSRITSAKKSMPWRSGARGLDGLAHHVGFSGVGVVLDYCSCWFRTYHQRNGVGFVNASICDEGSKAMQAPIVVDL